MTREEERRIAAELGEGPLVMFDDGLPLQFLHRQSNTRNLDSMGELTKKENEWLDKATAAAIAGARKPVACKPPIRSISAWQVLSCVSCLTGAGYLRAVWTSIALTLLRKKFRNCVV